MSNERNAQGLQQVAMPMNKWLAEQIKQWEQINAPIAKSEEVLKWKSEHPQFFE